MIENKQTLETLKELASKNNGIEFAKNIASLLREGRTPYIAYNEIVVLGNPPSTTPEKIGCQSVYTGTAIDFERRGVICANSAKAKINYFSEDGELIEKSNNTVKCQKSLLELPMTFLNRITSRVLRHHPTITRLIGDEIYLIERCEINIENHRLRSPYKENLLNEVTLPELKYASAEEYRGLFKAVASERRASKSL